MLSSSTKKCYRHPLRLHRAFSVVLFDRLGPMLIRKRSAKKLGWRGFLSNACCSHPQEGECIKHAALRRLREELGISADLRFLFTFEHRTYYDAVWGEHELDHVFVGQHDGPLAPEMGEVEDARFMDLEDLKRDVRDQPDRYTPWLRICLDRVLSEQGS